MRASKGAQGSADISRGVPYLPGAVTAENFVEKAKAWALGDDMPIVRRADNAIAFWAWIAFWNRIGKKTPGSERAESLTVPTVFPWDFSVDADALRDEDLVPFERRDETLTPERCRELAAMLRGTMPRDLAGYKPRRPNNPRLPDGYGAAHEATAETPLASDALLATLGRARAP